MSDNVSYHPNYQPVSDSTGAGTARKAHIIAVTSGKGGVGKTNITTNLGIALATRHTRVCIFDADTNLANINILLGLSPKYTLEHLLNGERTLDEIITEGPRGVHIIPAASGITQLTSLDQEQQSELLEALHTLESRYDYLIIDTGAGVGETVLSFLKSAQQNIVVISPEPTSLTDAFSLIKVMKKQDIDKPVYVIVNMVINQENGVEVFRRFEHAVSKYLKKRVHYLGHIPLDENIINSVSLQQPVIIQKPTATSSRCFFNLATTISEKLKDSQSKESFTDYWKESIESAPAPEKQISPSMDSPATEPEDITADRLLEKTTEYLEKEDTSENDAGVFLQQLLEFYLKRFRTFPGDAKKTLYHSLETGLISDDEIRDLVLTLQSVYEKRSGQPIRSADDIMIKLLSDIQGSENEIQDLHKLLQESYMRQFGKPIYNPEEELLKLLRNSQSSEEDFHNAVEAIKSTYQERFNKPLEDEKDKALANIRGITEKMQKKEQELMSGIARMSEWFNETIEAREELMRQTGPAINVKPDTPESDKDS